LDGGGYPRGLSAAELTMPMRLLAIADVYEALTSDRPYRPALQSENALAVIRADVPDRLDREAFAALESLIADSPPRSPPEEKNCSWISLTPRSSASISLVPYVPSL